MESGYFLRTHWTLGTGTLRPLSFKSFKSVEYLKIRGTFNCFASQRTNNFLFNKSIMKRLFISLLSLLAITASAQVGFGDAQKFNQDWLFQLGDDSLAVNPSFDDS